MRISTKYNKWNNALAISQDLHAIALGRPLWSPQNGANDGFQLCRFPSTRKVLLAPFLFFFFLQICFIMVKLPISYTSILPPKNTAIPW